MDAYRAQLRLVQRLLDGTHRWGSVEIRPTRFGVAEHRLVVYPPGLSTADRRWVRVSRGWPVWGFGLWLLCPIWLSGSVPHWAVFALSTAISLSAGAVTAALAGNVRTQVRTLTVTTMAGHDDAYTLAARDRLFDLAALLRDADDRLGRGEIDLVEHELVWWQVYRSMDDAASPHHTA
jgi:hypothetical protein